jgi:hypothetical protein
VVERRHARRVHAQSLSDRNNSGTRHMALQLETGQRRHMKIDDQAIWRADLQRLEEVARRAVGFNFER